MAKIIQQNKNPLLKREELLIEFNQEIPPSFEEVKKEIGKDESLMVIKRVDGNFGSKKYIAEAVVYNSVEDKEKIEIIPKKVRKKMKEERKAEEEAKKKAEAAAKKAEEEARAAEETKPAEASE